MDKRRMRNSGCRVPSSLVFIYAYRLFRSSCFSTVPRAKHAIKNTILLKICMVVIRNRGRRRIRRMHPPCKDPVLNKKKKHNFIQKNRIHYIGQLYLGRMNFWKYQKVRIQKYAAYPGAVRTQLHAFTFQQLYRMQLYHASVFESLVYMRAQRY